MKVLQVFNVDKNLLSVFPRNDSSQGIDKVLDNHVQSVDVILLRLHELLEAVIAFGLWNGQVFLQLNVFVLADADAGNDGRKACISGRKFVNYRTWFIVRTNLSIIHREKIKIIDI